MDVVNLMDGDGDGERMPSPLCSARSKRSGMRCRRRVPGGGVCSIHGGKAPQVARAREFRVAVAEARALFSDRYPAREWSEALPAAAQTLDQLTRWLSDQLEREEFPSAERVDVLMMAAEKSARLAKLVQDAGLDERRLQVTEQTANAIVAVIKGALTDLGLDPGSEHVQRVVSARLQELAQ